ncbi:hypothetical protein D9M70_587060 [compost metagenome]
MRGQRVPGLGDAFGQLPAHGGVGHFRDRAAAGTDHQQVVGRAAGVMAGAPGVDRVQAVDEAFVHQEIQGAIHRGGRGARVHRAHGIQQFIGLQAAAVAQQQFQDLAADGGEAASALLAQRLGDAELGVHGVAAG